MGMRTCKNKYCKKRYDPKNEGQAVCEYTCGIEYTKQLREKKNKALLLNNYRKNKIIKESIMPLKDWKKILQPLVNHIARLIDYGNPCISCGRTTGKPQGGHYHSSGGNAMITFNLHNIFLQDYRCNHQKSANIIGYNKGLAETFGKEYHEYIEFGLIRDYKSVKSSIPEIKDAIKKARVIIKDMKENNKVRTPAERKRMRRILNRIIGIYPR